MLTSEMIWAQLKNGFRTSEFWLALIAILAPFVFSTLDTPVQTWAARNGWVGGLVAAVYAAARAYVKVSAVQAHNVAVALTTAPSITNPPVNPDTGVRVSA